MSRFIFTPFTEEGREEFQNILGAMEALEGLIEMIPNSREKSLALTKLEEASHWACMAIVRRPSHEG